MLKAFDIYELKHEEKKIGSIEVAEECLIEPYLRGIFSCEYGEDIYKRILDDFNYSEVAAIDIIGSAHTHYIRADWTIDVVRTK